MLLGQSLYRGIRARRLYRDLLYAELERQEQRRQQLEEQQMQETLALLSRLQAEQALEEKRTLRTAVTVRHLSSVTAIQRAVRRWLQRRRSGTLDGG